MPMTTIRTTTVRCEHCGRTNRVPAVATGSLRCGVCHKPLPWVVDASDEDFVQVVERATVAVLVDLWAPWCGPCRRVSPALEQLARQMAGQLKLVKVNVDGSPALAHRFAVQAIPTLLILNCGQELSRQVGAAAAPALRSWVQHTLAATGGRPESNRAQGTASPLEP
jgi:thioredoxin 2